MLIIKKYTKENLKEMFGCDWTDDQAELVNELMETYIKGEDIRKYHERPGFLRALAAYSGIISVEKFKKELLEGTSDIEPKGLLGGKE